MPSPQSPLQINLLRDGVELLSMPLRTDRLLIGRGRRCDLRIPDRRVSRVHLEFVRRDQRWLCSNRGRLPIEVRHPAGRNSLGKGSQIRFGPYSLTLSETQRSSATREWHRPEVSDDEPIGSIIGRSPSMKRAFALLRRISQSPHPALIIGETGTGKELAARALHTEGPRAAGPWVAVNCAAITDSLFESELFGHVRGSFTGATGDRQGAFQQADGGVLFLDEIGELKLEMQAKLLRVLETLEVRPVGGQPTRVNVRIIAATNRDLPQMVAEGSFREDLFFRLCILEVPLPPLRERGSDVLEIARRIAKDEHSHASLTPCAEAALLEHRWPGNVRQLKNAIQRAICIHGTEVKAEHLPVGDGAHAAWHSQVETRSSERHMLKAALTATGGNRSHAARALGIPRSTLLHRLTKNGLKGWHPQRPAVPPHSPTGQRL